MKHATRKDRSAVIGLEKGFRIVVRDRRNKHWFTADNAIWDVRISKCAKLVYLYLCRCAEDKSTCYPSFGDIERKTSCSHGSVVGALQELERFGLIKRRPRIGTSTTYEVLSVLKDRSTGDLSSSTEQPGQAASTPEPPVDHPTQTPVDPKEDRVQKKTFVKETTSAPSGAVGPVEAKVFESKPPAGPAAELNPVALYCDGYKTKTGLPFLVAKDGKDAGILKQLHQDLGNDDYRACLAALFATKDSFIRDNHYAPNIFRLKINALLAQSKGIGVKRGRSSTQFGSMDASLPFCAAGCGVNFVEGKACLKSATGVHVERPTQEL